MKKIFIIALTVLVSASFNTIGAKDKKKKEQETIQPVEVVSLENASDSLSYAAGMNRTNGLIPYLQQQFDVDTAYIANFIEGYNTTMNSEISEEFKAYSAGQQIAMMVSGKMLPSIKEQFTEYPDSIIDAVFNLGFVNAIKNDYALMTDSAANKYFTDAAKQATDAVNEKNRKAGEDFLAENKTKEGVVTTESGLQYKVLVEGDGEIPTSDQEVTVKYEGRLIDGTVFDSSYKRPGETAKFRPTQVIKGWTEALTMMPVGSKWELYIPQELAYGARKSGNINPYSALIFTVELVSVAEAKPKADSKAAPTVNLSK